MKLFFTDGHKKGEKHELSPPGISIGRELDNDIILELEGASRYHAKLEWKDNNWFLKDLGSTNGTKLNGTKITANEEQKLKEGDNILIGKQTIHFAETYDESKTTAASAIAKDSEPAKEDKSKTSEPSAVTLSEMEPSDKDKKDDGKESSTMDDSQSFLNFFDKKDDEKAESGKAENKMDFFGKKDGEGSAESKSSKRHAGILFYVAVIGAAIILIAGFLILERAKENKPTQHGPSKKKLGGAPLLLRYEKQVTSSNPKNNIFRFLLEIKGGKVTITRDDLQAGLRDQPTRRIGLDKLQELVEKFQETDFMSLEQGQSGLPRAGEDKRFSLSIAFGKEFNKIEVNNTTAPSSFEKAERIIDDFCANTLNVPTISLTPAELKEEGMDAYRRGKQLFDNYRAQNENLYKCIREFKVAIENLESFQPQPPEYNDAYKLQNEATRILREQIHTHERNAITYRKREKFAEAKEEYKAIMEKTAPGSKPYKKAREYIIQLEEIMRIRKK